MQSKMGGKWRRIKTFGGYHPPFWRQQKQKYQWYYPHRSKDSVSPVCGIFKDNFGVTHLVLFASLFSFCWQAEYLHHIQWQEICSQPSNFNGLDGLHGIGNSFLQIRPILIILPLDRVGPIDNRPSTILENKNDHDMLHVTLDTWPVGEVNLLSKYELPSSYGLVLKVFWRNFHTGWLTHWITELMDVQQPRLPQVCTYIGITVLLTTFSIYARNPCALYTAIIQMYRSEQNIAILLMFKLLYRNMDFNIEVIMEIGI